MHQLMDVTATYYEPFKRRSELKANVVCDVNEVSRAFISHDEVFGITVGKGQKSKHFEVDEFKFIATNKVYEETFKKINKGEIKLEHDKATIGLLTYADVLRKYDKDKQKKVRRRIRYVSRVYEDNCLILAANKLCSQIGVI